MWEFAVWDSLGSGGLCGVFGEAGGVRSLCVAHAWLGWDLEVLTSIGHRASPHRALESESLRLGFAFGPSSGFGRDIGNGKPEVVSGESTRESRRGVRNLCVAYA